MPDLRDSWRGETAPASAPAPEERAQPAKPAPVSPPPPAPSFADPLAAPPGQLANFWLRILAAFADSLLLAAVGWLVARGSYDWLVEIGQKGRIIGWVITLAYFGVMNSRMGAGGTIGKLVFGLRVVGRNGEYVPFSTALLRAIVYTVPFYLNGADFSGLALDHEATLVLDIMLAVVVFGGIASIIYLYVANSRTRQSLHDLVAGTFVVRMRALHAPVTARIYPVHIAIVLAWCALIGAAVPLGLQYAASMPWTQAFAIDLKQANQFKAIVNADPSVAGSTVMVGYGWLTVFNSQPTAVDFVMVNARLRAIPDDAEKAAEEIATRLLQAEPDLMGHQRLTLIVRYGYDLGITSDWRTFTYSGTPAEWRAKLRQDGAALPT